MTSQEMDEQDEGLEGPMNQVTQTVSPAERQILPVLPSLILPIAVAILLTVVPFASQAVGAQTLREAAKTAAGAQATSCQAQAQEFQKECEAEEAEENDGTPDRSGLGWTGIGLASAGLVQTGIGLNVSRWRSCGPGSVRHCRNLERVYRITGGTLLATGLTLFVSDEVRRHRNRGPARRQTVVDIGPRTIQVRMLF